MPRTYNDNIKALSKKDFKKWCISHTWGKDYETIYFEIHGEPFVVPKKIKEGD